MCHRQRPLTITKRTVNKRNDNKVQYGWRCCYKTILDAGGIKRGFVSNAPTMAERFYQAFNERLLRGRSRMDQEER